MPITRFKTFKEAEEALWCAAPDAAYFERVRKMFALASRLSRLPAVKPGIYKFRSIDDAGRERALPSRTQKNKVRGSGFESQEPRLKT